MSGPETIAVIRDLSIIVAAVVFIGIFVPAGILYFRLYRSLSRAGRNMENITSMVLESVVRPLTSLTSLLEVVNHIVGLVQRRSPERSVGDGKD
ncbi:MAG TPA: hypothetical protein VI855_09595 [Dehalococcoidia bacterium]|nr:hypothetical protein [Dehalococcoidia bacterium]